jgi:hypothetical protein
MSRPVNRYPERAGASRSRTGRVVDQYVGVVFAALLDVALNKARVTRSILDAISSSGAC